MADTQAPTVSGELKDARNYFDFLRAGFGLPLVERDKVTVDHIKEVMDALGKFDGNFAKLAEDSNKVRGTKTNAGHAEFIISGAARSMLVMLAQNPSLQAASASRDEAAAALSQVLNAQLPSQIGSFVLLRAAVGLPEKDAYTVEDAKQTKTALEALKKDPNHVAMITQRLAVVLDGQPKRGDVINLIDDANKTFVFLEANLPSGPAAPAPVATPAPAAPAPVATTPAAPAPRVYSGRGGTKPSSPEVLLYQAKIEIMTVGLALGHKLKKVEELTPAKIKEITDQVKARKLADGKAITPALYLANYKQNAAEIPDAALKTRIQQGALVGSGRAMPGDTAIPRNIARMEAELTQNVALVASAAPAPAVAATGAAAPAAGRAAQAAASAPAAPVDKTAEIKFVEETLGKMKISVGTVDGKTDDAFHKGTTQFKNLLAAFAGVKVADGVCTPAECDQLLTGLNKFLGDKEQIDALKAVMQGKAPAGMATAKAKYVEFEVKDMTPAQRIFFALEYAADERAEGKAKGQNGVKDPSMKQALAAMPKEIRDNLDTIFTTLENDGAKLLQNLKVVYTPTAAAPAAPGAQVPAPAAVTTAPAAPPAPATTEPRDISKDIRAVEFTLHEFISPMLKNVTGVIGKLGFSDSLLPVITQEDLDDKGADGKAVFGAKSQRMTAMTVMVLKEMAGYERADGTYTKEIGEDLLMKIMTDDKMKMVRDKVGIPKLTPELAEAVLAKDAPTEPAKLAEGASAADKKAYEAELKEYQKLIKLREKADALKKFFESLNNLHDNGLLMKDDQAASVTKGNMMIDAASAALDKWAPGLKKMLVNFLQNTAIGQMIGGVMGMMGMDVSRLWEKPENHKTPQQVLDNSIIAVSKTFESEFNKAQKELGADAPFAAVMAKTKKSITDDMNGWIASTTMKALLPGGSEDDVKKLVQKALEAAEKQKNGVDAQKAFTETLQAGGLQWQKEKKLDFATLDKYVAETRTQVQALQAEGSGAGFVAPRPAAPAAPASGGGRVDAAPAAAPQPLTREQQMARLKLDEAGMAKLEKEQAEWERQRASGESYSKSSPMKLAEMNAGVWGQDRAAAAGSTARGAINFELGDKVVSIIPGSAETASGVFQRQLPVRASNGRMGAITEVLYENFDKLGITGIKKEQLLGKDGKPLDGASHAVVQALTELSVRSQLRIDPSKEADPKLTHMTINAYAIAQMQHLGIDPAAIDKAKKAIDSMAVDHASFVGGTKGQKAPAGGWPSVLEQTFAGYVYKVEIKDKPAPAPAAPVAPAAPAKPAGPYDGIAVDPKDAAIFDAYKGHNAKKGGPNCEPLFFAMDSKGTILSAADYQKKVAQKEDVSDFKAYAALVDQKAKRFEVLSIGDGKDNYIFTRKLPDAVADKIIDNYTIRIKQNGQDVDVGLGKAPTAEQRPLVIAEIKKAIDCALGLKAPELVSEFSGPAQPHRAPVETRTPVPTEQELERQRRAAVAEQEERERAHMERTRPAREAEERYREQQRRALAEAYQQRGQGHTGQFNNRSGMECTVIDRPNKWNLLRFLGAEGAKISTCTMDVTGYPMGAGGYPGGIHIRQQGFSNTVNIGGRPIGD